MKIYFATENLGKLREVEAILKKILPQCELFSVHDLTPKEKENYIAEEIGVTYAQNALIKAQSLAHALSMPATSFIHPWILDDAKTASMPATSFIHPWILAEDSGFEVLSLNGEPGVYSARFAPNDKERIQKVLQLLQGKPRRARFVSCVTLLENGKNPIYFFGRKEGIVAEVPRGKDGFGYDPIFIPEGASKTWGEVTKEEKNVDSHRSRAFRLAAEYILSSMSQHSL